MSKRKIIAITGNIAGGKSKVTRKIATKLGMDTYYASDRFRKLARENNMDLATFNAFIENNSEIDREIDTEMSEYINSHNNLVVDARLAWHFAKDAFKVCIKVDLDVAANRLVKDVANRNIEERYETVDTAKIAIIKRERYERERYIREYGVDILDYSNYDLVIDSTNMSTDEIADMIIDNYNNWLTK